MDKLFDRLHIKHPIIQAGMAGITTPDLVANVANHGALGTIGAGYMTGKALREFIHHVKDKTDKPFAVNVFATNLSAESKQISEMQDVLNDYRHHLDIPKGRNSVQVHDYLEEKIQVIIDEKIPIVSTAFGVLLDTMIAKLKENDVMLIGMATNLNEAKQLVDSGYDGIVAQGSEAGGHRGTFDMKRFPNGCNIGLHTLVQSFCDHLSVPIIAAGGITGKKQIDALLMLGATGVQLGTRFLVAEEAGTNPAYVQALMEASAAETIITKVFSGRPARAIENTFIRQMEGDIPLQPFPVQNELTKDIRGTAKMNGNPAFQSLWAGQGVGEITKQASAKEIIEVLTNPR